VRGSRPHQADDRGSSLVAVGLITRDLLQVEVDLRFPPRAVGLLRLLKLRLPLLQTRVLQLLLILILAMPLMLGCRSPLVGGCRILLFGCN
jgi:hypothetical protein